MAIIIAYYFPFFHPKIKKGPAYIEVECCDVCVYVEISD